jgi:hypothetical protein
MATELTTVPTFTYRQGKHSDDTFEDGPITVEYYGNSICLKQEGYFESDETITISPKHLNALFMAIKKHYPEALKVLNK